MVDSTPTTEFDSPYQAVTAARGLGECGDYRAAIETLRSLLARPSAGEPRCAAATPEAIDQLVKIGHKILDDRELPRFAGFTLTRQILRDLRVAEHEDDDPEMMRLAGRYHTKLWFFRGRRRDIEMAIDFFLRGFHPNEAHASLKNGVSAAFCLDMLAATELEEGPHEQPLVEALTPAERDLRERAREIRSEILRLLPRSVHVAHSRVELNETLDQLLIAGEAFFGLGRFEEAREQFAAAATVGASDPDFDPDREIRRVARHLAHIVKVNARNGDPGMRTGFQTALSGIGDPDIVESADQGSLGLALSGGGFRAALFHVGVLARMAELGLLEKVEVLSCVSGGSIVGAHYYLELKHLLESTPDDELTTDDYIEIVQRVAVTMLRAVDRNMRTRVVNNPWKNLKMAIRDDYSPSNRLGELLDTEVFSRATGAPRGGYHLHDMRIVPARDRGDASPQSGDAFRPKKHNWRRKHKVPILILNATSLNTGHGWQFTSKGMGEPGETIESAIDSNVRLRRSNFEHSRRRVPLGEAVAASAAVPGIFEPIGVDHLYVDHLQNDWRVRLVDGGVHDNQGVAALLELECDHVIVSDASGQVHSDRGPGQGALSVPLRSNTILMQRIRGAQYSDLYTRTDAQQIESFAFVTMNAGLDPIAITPRFSPQDRSDRSEVDRCLQEFGIRRGTQSRLADVRTDLDSFCELEAAALMTQGYVVSDRRVEHVAARIDRAEGERELDLGDVAHSKAERWPFLHIYPLLSAPETDGSPCEQRFNRVLAAGQRRFFRLRHLFPALKATTWIAGVIALVVFLSTSLFGVPVAWSIPSWIPGAIVAAVLLAWAFGFILRRTRLPVEWQASSVMWNIAFFIVVGILGPPIAWAHLATTDRVYRRMGRLSRCTPVPPDWVSRWRNRVAESA